MSIIALKIALEYIEPAVTRTLQVSANIRLARLHLTIQAAMGWTNSHLYMFEAGGATWGPPDPDFGTDDLPANKTTLAELIEDTGARSINYLYDFGDDWVHDLTCSAAKAADPNETYPRLTAVAGTCPPEDIGGPPGYEMFCEAMADPKHPEHKNLKDWYGGAFDPKAPPQARLRAIVLGLAKRWAGRKKPSR